MSQTTTDSILYALFCLSRDTRHIDAAALGRAVGVSPTLAARVLVELERVGLVDASRARLTMAGLARAAVRSASGSGGPRIELGHAQPRRPAKPMPVPLAARSDTAAGPQEVAAHASDPAGALHA